MLPAPRIIVVKISALGDVVMASTLVGALRHRWPGGHVTWVTGHGLVRLVSRFRGIDQVIGVDVDALLRGSLLARAEALAKAAWAVGRGPYALGIVAHTDRRYGALLWGARVAETRYFRNGALPRGTRRGVWMGAEYARLVEDDAQAPTITPRLAALTGDSAGATRSGTSEVLLAPGGARNVLRDDWLRRWPVESWVRLAGALVDAGHSVTLIGGAKDASEGAQLAQAVPGVANLIGRTTLEQLLTHIEGARLLVTHDSGPLHLAALARTPTVALFGPTAPAERIESGAPIVVASAAAGLPCAPCYDGFGYAPCTHKRCLTEVSVDQVMQLARPFLRASQAQTG